MRKLIKNNTTSYIKVKSIGLHLSPSQVYELTGDDKLTFVYDEVLLNYIRSGDIVVGYWDNTFFTSVLDSELWFRTVFDEDSFISDGNSLTEYTGGVVTDVASGKRTTSLFMNILTIMKELYNDSSSPIYDSNFQKFVGTGGREQEHLARTYNLEVIHGKVGWHEREIVTGTYIAPKNLLIYYGWINSFNSAVNGWYNEKVAQDMAKYNLIVFGDGVENPSHGDYANTSIVISRIKALNPNTLIFGYVSCNQSLANFQTKVDQWDTLQIHGIFIDESGYDYGSTATNGRSAFNTKVDYVHGKTYSDICFINAWNVDHIIGINNDVSYPNSTYNPDVIASTLTYNDWYLLESFPVNTTAFSGNAGYETKTDWIYRGEKAIVHRNTYGINIAACGIINDSNASGQNLFNFLYISALMWCLEAVGSSDTTYGSNSATSKYWTRPNVIDLGKIWRNSPAVTLDGLDSDVYWRFVEYAKLMLDFSTGAQTSSITKF